MKMCGNLGVIKGYKIPFCLPNFMRAIVAFKFKRFKFGGSF
nr:hypothetical protein [uncultured Campylobacter sp.]